PESALPVLPASTFGWRFRLEVSSEHGVVHEQLGAQLKLLSGVAFAMQNEAKLIVHQGPVDLEPGIIGSALDAPGRAEHAVDVQLSVNDHQIAFRLLHNVRARQGD